ncbi:iduronate-2-sulfatase [Haloferula helveola]|uniref:Iduronate-2-sulfatase n=1 Tax=Haloferula helveola TaxID=490095 RepID=A0ABM7RHH5_9BACT|nr:iduronate-2-sulfatase [Haloferula helveola]
MHPFLTLSVILCGLAFTAIARSAEPIRNVLFIIADDLKANALGAYGNEICQTPNLDRLASRSMVFDLAFCQGTWCAPSRQSLMHSRYIGNRGPTLGKHLIAHGRYSARVGKIFHMRVPGDIIDGTDGRDVPETWTERFNCKGQEAHTPGLYRLLNQNIETRAPENRQSTAMPHRMFVSVESDGDGSAQPDWKAAEKAVEILQARADSPEPFFLAVGFVRPHYPSVAPAEHFRRYPFEKVPAPVVPEGDINDIPKPGRAPTTSEGCGIAKFPDNIRKMRADYYATVTFMDEQLGKVLDELDRRKLRDSTLIIFTSDHGYHLGEHDFWQKSTLHEDVIRVPFLISAPGMKTGRTRSLAELADIYPTVCDLLGVPIPESAQGESLKPVLQDPEAKVRQAAFALNPPKGHAIRTDEWAYMRYRNGEEELYRMSTDPGQIENLASRKELAGTKRELKRMLDEKVAQATK